MGKVLITAQQSVDLEDLAEYLADRVRERDDLLEFLLAVDAAVADLQFTKELHKTLGEVIELEEG